MECEFFGIGLPFGSHCTVGGRSGWNLLVKSPFDSRSLENKFVWQESGPITKVVRRAQWSRPSSALPKAAQSPLQLLAWGSIPWCIKAPPAPLPTHLSLASVPILVPLILSSDSLEQLVFLSCSLWLGIHWVNRLGVGCEGMTMASTCKADFL